MYESRRKKMIIIVRWMKSNNKSAEKRSEHEHAKRKRKVKREHEMILLFYWCVITCSNWSINSIGFRTTKAKKWNEMNVRTSERMIEQTGRKGRMKELAVVKILSHYLYSISVYIIFYYIIRYLQCHIHVKIRMCRLLSTQRTAHAIRNEFGMRSAAPCSFNIIPGSLFVTLFLFLSQYNIVLVLLV